MPYSGLWAFLGWPSSGHQDALINLCAYQIQALFPLLLRKELVAHVKLIPNVDNLLILSGELPCHICPSGNNDPFYESDVLPAASKWCFRLITCVLFESCRQVAYSSPVPPQLYGPLAAVFVTGGLAFMSISFVQQMNATKADQSVTKDFPLVLTSSALLGCGALFVLLWSGVYV